MIHRVLEPYLLNTLQEGKIVVLLGARRVGKTTLVKSLLQKLPESKYINCELLQNKEALETTNSELLYSFLGNYKYIVLDEAQSIKNIGQVLKIVHDTFPSIKVIATGSSAFYLHQQIGEPLTGRSRFFTMSPLSFQEIANHQDIITANAQLENMLRFGLYPEVYGKPETYAIEELENIASNYLYKDILQFEKLKKPDLLYNLLKALAFQIGSEVSFNELSNILGVHINTIKRYIELLEQNFVIFRLSALSRNPRNEIGSSQKIFFYDCGIRNAIIRNFNMLSIRNDVGQLWENFFVAERRKFIYNHRKYVNTYFWRNYQKKEIDYIEESNSKLQLFECKYSSKKAVRVPKDFEKNYSDFNFYVANSENYWKFLM